MLRALIGLMGNGLSCVALTLVLVLPISDAEARTKRGAQRAQVAAPKVVGAQLVSATRVASTVVPLLPAPTLPVTALTPPRSTASPAPLVAAVSLNAQTITLYSGTEVVARSSISSGMAGHRTPTGVFSIIQKARYHESNIYDNAPMPFMQRLTWSGIALHAGNLPGYPASHGCVRLPSAFAERLFGMLKMGTRVVVSHEIVTPAPIVHAALPKPIYTPVTLVASSQAQPTRLGPNLILASTGAPANDSSSADAALTRLLTPPEAAEVEKQRAQTALIEAQADARRMLDIAADTALSAAEAARTRQDIERDIATFQSQLQRAKADHTVATDDEARVQAEASIAAFEDAIADATAVLADVRQVETSLVETSFADARRARDAEDAADRADAALRTANRGSEPITVFISRADSRVQVRQGFHTILDGEAIIRDAHLPLGTHVMTAGALLDPASGLRWTSVSLSDGAPPPMSAFNALSRITIEPQLSDEIGRRVWAGATVLISDQPASRETGRGTDFVVLTK